MAREKLNDLTGKEWVKLSKSVWIDNNQLGKFTEVDLQCGVLASTAPKRDELKKMHPATFSEEDIKKLILFFTKKGEIVLDPFIGSGSTAIASIQTGRKCIGFELYEKWYSIAVERVKKTGLFNKDVSLKLTTAIEGLKHLEDESIDLILTSPPYWGILKKVDHKAKRERVYLDLETDYGNHPEDLSNKKTYEEFLSDLEVHFKEFYRVIKREKYAVVIVSDFRHRSKYYMFHADVGILLEKTGFVLHGLINLVQNSKNLYPYGYPTSFVPNICNQFAVCAVKP
ncbi:MAG: DNA methyltransferase [archaeon]